MDYAGRNGAETACICEGEPSYPGGLKTCLGDQAPPSVTGIGEVGMLGQPKLAFFCSTRCPGSLILRTYDLAQLLRQSPLAVVGGFHTPMEQECLAVLLRGPEPVILCPARNVERLRLPAEHREPLRQGRLLILSGFGEGESRVTAETAAVRNRFVAALADALFVAHAAPGGRTEEVCREAIAWGKGLYTFEDRANENLLVMGAVAVEPGMFLKGLPDVNAVGVEV